MSIKENLKAINDKISQAATKAGRDPSEVKLVAVSKRHPLELIKEAYHSGHFLFGENYVQEG